MILTTYSCDGMMQNTNKHPLTIADNEIHIWMINPLQHTCSSTLVKYRNLLNQEEKEKVDRYKFKKHQHDALITRAFARDTLEKYLPISAENICFSKGEHGKPDLLPSQALTFNLSHTEELIICAISKNVELGIDCEHIDRNNDILNIADRYFSPSEVEELFSLPEEKQRSRFFDYWTLKESYIKACGQGLAIPLDHFSFHIPDQQASYAVADIKQGISLSFSKERQDNSKLWQSWLAYPSNSHRLAISVKSPTIQPPAHLKFFTSVPLSHFQEIKLDQHTLFV